MTQRPQSLPLNISSEMECLKPLITILISQDAKILNAITGFENDVRYVIKDETGGTLFIVTEDSCCCFLDCCGGIKPLNLILHNIQKHEIIYISKVPQLFHEKLTVSSVPDKNIIGECHHTRGRSNISVKNEHDEHILTIQRLRLGFWKCFKGRSSFNIMTPNEEVVGKLTKDSEDLVINFPEELDVKTKVVLIGACILVVSI